MNVENIITVLLSATIPSVITYLITKKNCDSKIKSIQISSQTEIDKLRLEHKHEIERIEAEHNHQIEKIELEYKLQKDNKSNAMSSEMAMKFFNGELDLDNILSNMNNLKNIQNKVQKFNSNKHTSDFVKKQ